MSVVEIFKSKSNEEIFCNTSMMNASVEVFSRDKVIKNNFAYSKYYMKLFLC